jgi:DNA modification methylase
MSSAIIEVPQSLTTSVAPDLSEIIVKQASAFHIPLKDKCIQCVVTSPPYYNLRVYEGNSADAFGREKTIQLYVEHTIEVLREIRRTLKKNGVVFWNVGDCYSGSSKGNGGKKAPKKSCGDVKPGPTHAKIPPKNLCLIPERIAIAAQEDGWCVRDKIIWHKPNCVPESVTDRCTSSYEVILMLTKQEHYYFDNEAIKEPATSSSSAVIKKPNGKYGKLKLCPSNGGKKHKALGKAKLIENKPKIYKTRNKRNVWSIPTHPHKEAHTAMFPEELPRICIKAGSKEGQLILDPFAGSGTTGIVAKALGRSAVLLDISSKYVKLMKERLKLPEDEHASPKKAA